MSSDIVNYVMQIDTASPRTFFTETYTLYYFLSNYRKYVCQNQQNFFTWDYLVRDLSLKEYLI